MRDLRKICQALGIMVAATGLVGPTPSAATPITLTANLDGFQEVDDEGNPGQGDLDGSGTAILVIDSENLTVDWDISFQGIDLPLTGAHIHQAPAGVNGPIVVDFMAQPSGSGLFDPDLANVIASPAGFYVNLHNEPFPAGAIRGQLSQVIPEPATFALFGIGLAALVLLAKGPKSGPMSNRAVSSA